jgi:hypothetical protein
MTLSALRPGQPDDHESGRDDRQQPDYSTDPAPSAARDVSRETDIGIFDGGYRSSPSSPQDDEWQ